MHEHRCRGVGAVADEAEDESQEEDKQGDGGDAVLHVGDGKNKGSGGDAENGLQRTAKQQFFADACGCRQEEPFSHGVDVAEEGGTDVV